MNRFCPFCGKLCDRHEGVDDPTAAPADDDFSLCIGCGEWGVFQASAPGGLRKPTDDEYVELVAAPEMARMRRAWVLTMRAERRENRRRK